MSLAKRVATQWHHVHAKQYPQEHFALGTVMLRRREAFATAAP